MADRDRACMSEYWTKLSEKLRAGLAEDSAFFNAAPPPSTDPMPDLAPSPDLLKIVAMAKEGTRGIIDLDDDDWHVLIDETMYQIASALRRDESIVLPSLGTLEIVYGEGGAFGRLTLDDTARPEVML
jgi:hypothetical protein